MQENQRIALTKRLLREGLLRLLKEKSLDKINVAELCRESGINRTTFYRHYELPVDILAEIEQEIIRGIYDLSPRPYNLQEAEQSAERILSYLYAQADLIKILIQYKTDGDFFRVLNEFYQSFLELKGAIQSISELDDDNMKLLFSYCVGGIYFLLRQWLVEGIDKTPKEISDLIIRFLDKGFTF